MSVSASPATPEPCHTYTHHVGDGIRVECQEHPRFVTDVPTQPKGAERTTRQVVDEVRRLHEEGREVT